MLGPGTLALSLFPWNCSRCIYVKVFMGSWPPPCTPGNARPRQPRCGTLGHAGPLGGRLCTCETQKLKKEATTSLWPVCPLLWAPCTGPPKCASLYVWTGTSPRPGRPHRHLAPPWGWRLRMRRDGVCPGFWCSRGACRGAGLGGSMAPWGGAGLRAVVMGGQHGTPLLSSGWKQQRGVKSVPGAG